jgi:magnesium transporter
MSKFIKKRTKTIGLPPGSLIHIGEEKTTDVKIKVIDYYQDQIEEKEIKNIEECFPYKDKKSITWINIDGVHKAEIFEKIGKYYGIHSLVLEDIMNTGQRPKIEDFDSYIYIVLKMLNMESKEISSKQISIIIGDNFVISFQEGMDDVFNAIRDRIRNNKGRIRKMGADYLAYSLMDAIVDNYYIILESISEKIENIEDEVITNPTPVTIQTIHSLKRELIMLRKSIWPLREVVNGFHKTESSLIKKSSLIYIRDLYDHTIQVMDIIETFRDMNSGMLDIYMSSISNKMNEVMKVLTIFAAIFIPLTFVAGIYGMNFDYMPELTWYWGYPLILTIMISMVIVMLFYFRRKSWL